MYGPAHKYSNDLFLVRISKPIGLDYLDEAFTTQAAANFWGCLVRLL
jgi:hypothetical protein